MTPDRPGRSPAPPPRAIVLHPRLWLCGGAERVCLELIRILAALGYEVSLLSLDTPAELDAIARHLPRHAAMLAEVTLCPLPASLRHGLRRLALGRPFLAYGLLSPVFLAQSRGYQLLLSGWGELGLPRPLAGRRGRCFAFVHHPVFSTRREDRLATGRPGRSPLRTVAGNLASLALRRLLGLDRRHQSTTVMVNSAWTAQRIARLYPNLAEIHVVHPPALPAAPSLVRQARPLPPARRQDVGKGRVWRFVCLGRILPLKRQAMLARCLQELFARREDSFAFTIVGYGAAGDLAALRRELGGDPRISLHSNADEVEVARCLAAAELGLHGHPCEHFGLAVAEMVEAGIPVFVPSDGGQTEIVPIPELQYAGSGELATRIAALLDDAALRARVEAAIAALQGRFAVELFAARVSAIFTAKTVATACAAGTA